MNGQGATQYYPRRLYLYYISHFYKQLGLLFNLLMEIDGYTYM